MKHALDLFSFEGRVGRGRYVLAGAILFAIKYVLDTLVSHAFGQEWSVFMYVSPRVGPTLHPDAAPRGWLLTLLAVSLPFIAAGVSLTARRLRDIGAHPFWAGLFFFPYVHFALFTTLAVAPSDGAPIPSEPAPPLDPLARRVLPDAAGVRFALGVAAALAFGLSGYAFAMARPTWAGGMLPARELIGMGLFVGVPFGMGFWSGWIVSVGRPGGPGLAIQCAATSGVASLIVLIALSFEGVACIVMAAPLLLPVAVVGAWIGWRCTRTEELRMPGAALGLLLAPLLLAKDARDPADPAPIEVVSTVIIHAPPEVVWRNVVSFPPIDAPPAAVFAIVAMPLEARIEGHDPGATRRCIFTIGEFEEPILVWDEPRELSFGVRRAPEEISRFVEVERGQFLLSANADGTTTLRGTTWCRLRVHPSAYWTPWAESLLHAIHLRVL